ncbi:MAG: hypothetical protein R2862_07640 [Thermoanaerobaculia bacterium]
MSAPRSRSATRFRRPTSSSSRASSNRAVDWILAAGGGGFDAAETRRLSLALAAAGFVVLRHA